MNKGPQARVLALEGAVVVFFVVALIAIAAGAESHIAVLRALAAGGLIAFAGPFPARVFLEAIEPPAASAEETPESQAGLQAPGAARAVPRPARREKAA